MSVSNQLNYNLRPPATQARSYSYGIKTLSGAEQAGSNSQTIEFSIPTRPNSFLDQASTYLQFKVVPDRMCKIHDINNGEV